MKSNQKLTTKEFIERSIKSHTKKYDYSKSVYTGRHNKIEIICPIHGSFWQSAINHIKGYNCPKCGQRYNYNTKEFIQIAKRIHKNKFNYSKTKYKNMSTKIEIVCPIHGSFWQTPKNHIHNKCGCPLCNGGIKDNKKSFIKKANKIHGNKFDYSKVNYINSHTKVTIICPKHSEFEQMPYMHLQTIHSCPKCNNSAGRSKAEKEIQEYIQQLLPNSTIISNTRTLINPQEIDLYIPSKKIAFEYNGLYWHSNSHKPRSYHWNKTKKCNKKGISLIHIFENEWINQEKIVKSRISNLLGISTNSIGARKCIIKKVPFIEEKDFFFNNHLQRYIPSKICYGLYYNNTLVSAMSFSKPRFNKNIEWELLRFCNLVDYYIIGGASKLFKHFLEHIQPKSIISYADVRWTKGQNNVYKKLGFKFVEKTQPNYYYTKSFEIYNRMNFQKHKLPKLLDNFDSSLSEKQNMIANGYDYIYDCGNYKYFYS